VVRGRLRREVKDSYDEADSSLGTFRSLAAVGLVGTLLGVANQPPTLSARQRIAAMIGATRASETARFQYSSITISPNPLLRSTSRGSGALNFGTDSVSTVEDDRQTSLASSDNGPAEPSTQTIEIREIWIGPTSYDSVDPGIPGFDDRWVKTKFAANLVGSLGALGNVGPLAQVVSVESTPDVRIEDLGSEMLGTTSTTKFRMVPLRFNPSFFSTLKPLVEASGRSRGRRSRGRRGR